EILLDILAGLLFSLEPHGHPTTSGPRVIRQRIAILYLDHTSDFRLRAIVVSAHASPMSLASQVDYSLRFGFERTFQVRNIVGEDGDDFPSLLADFTQQVDVVGVLRQVVERDLLIFPPVHTARIPAKPELLVDDSKTPMANHPSRWAVSAVIPTVECLVRRG